MIDLPKDAEIFVPHRKPMRLIDTLIEYDGDSAVADACFEAGSIFVDVNSGRVEPLALIELIAQSYAAGKGYEDMCEGKETSKGYLVSISKAHFAGDAFAGRKLIINVRTEESIDDFYIAAGEVLHEEQVLATASLTIWVDSNSKQGI
jgi:predicted hotdog family 3-hydroxylacyl-ACP dehydratase